MSDRTVNANPALEAAQRRVRRRYAAERRFRAYGMAAVALAIAFLFLLIGSVVTKAVSAFHVTEIRLEIFFDPAVIDPDGKGALNHFAQADFAQLYRKTLLTKFADVKQRRDVSELVSMVSTGARFKLLRMVEDDPKIIGTTKEVWLPAEADIDMVVKGEIATGTPEAQRRINDKQLQWLAALQSSGDVRQHFNADFFTNGDSRQAELAGIWSAMVGSFFLILITLVLSFPVAVMAAVYLEEFAPKNRWTEIIEVNINNLAAVPSIVFGLLGLAVFLGFFGLPRSAPLVGGMVMALMTLPTIIIATRSALQAVPPWIRQAAQGMGASPIQVILHHVLPLAMPGVLTGTIIGLARALGETAPLLMIGMVAFMVDVPHTPLDPATALPVQIYLWAGNPERAFVEKTAAAVVVLLAFLIAMNGAAVFLRKKFERRW